MTSVDLSCSDAYFYMKLWYDSQDTLHSRLENHNLLKFITVNETKALLWCVYGITKSRIWFECYQFLNRLTIVIHKSHSQTGTLGSSEFRPK